MDKNDWRIVDHVFRYHKPIPQSGIEPFPDGTSPIMCKCGAGSDGTMHYSYWHDHFYLTLEHALLVGDTESLVGRVKDES